MFIAFFIRKARKFAPARGGSTMPIFALSLLSIFALVGATLALGMDSRSGNQVQQAADAAALGGASVFLSSNSARAETRLEEARVHAKALAENNSDYKLADLEVDAVSEDAYGQHTKLAVELEFQPVNFFAKFTGNSTTAPIRRRAVASSTWGFPLCILALGASDGAGLAMKHFAALTAEGCIVWSNDTSSTSMKLDGGRARGKSFCAAGLVDRSHRASVIPIPEQNCQPIPDPLKDWTPPAPGKCAPDQDFDPPLSIARASERKLQQLLSGGGLLGLANGRNGTAGTEGEDYRNKGLSVACHTAGGASNPNCPLNLATGTGLGDFDLLALTDNLPDVLYLLDRQFDSPSDTLSPGTYCGLDIAYGHVLMQPGTYFIKNAPMEISRKATVTAEGVTLIFTGPGAYLRVSDEGRLKLSAPTEGALAGIAVAERRNTKVGGLPSVSRLTGNGALNIIGLIYLPTQNFFISGTGAGEQASPLLQIVANRFSIRDTGKLKIDFRPGETDVPMAIKPARVARLIE